MKKLMIAAAIVCAAAMSQAATASWNIVISDPIYNGNVGATTLASGATAYMVRYGEYADGFEGLSQAALLSALQSGKTMTDTGIAEHVYGSATVGSDGKVSSTPVAFNSDWVEDGYASAYLVVIQDKAAFIGGDEWYEENGLDPTSSKFNPGTAATALSVDKTGKAAFSTAGWYATSAADVPEPTSAMLLLLGVAGLALRRRRA